MGKILKSKKPICWVFLDTRDGHKEQLMAVADRLKDFDIHYINVAFTRLSFIPNCLAIHLLHFFYKPTFIKHLMGKAKSAPPSIILSAGRRSLPIIRHIKKSLDSKVTVIQLMHPGEVNACCDVIFVTQYNKYKSNSNTKIIEIPGSPNRVELNWLEENKIPFIEDYKLENKKILVIAVGGDTKKVKYTYNHGVRLSNIVSVACGMANMTPVIIFSRRSGRDLINGIIDNIDDSAVIITSSESQQKDYHLLHGAMAASRGIIVTADSISMVSEACSMPITYPVWIFQDNNLHSKQFLDFTHRMYYNGYAKRFNDFDLMHIVKSDRVPMNSAKFVADYIKHDLNI